MLYTVSLHNVICQVHFNFKKAKTKQQILEKREKSHFQSYHFIRFKCPVFNQKNRKAYKEAEMYGQFKEKI